MGLFSSIKKGLSKAWKGVKKVVKGVAKGVKKVAKKVITSTPWGKKVWELGSKAWKGIKKGIGKIASKLGPVGMMALSFVLAPIVGPALGAMWSSFGAGAAAMATSANALVSTLGTIGNGVFAAGNFIGGTLGAMGNAISQGASNVMSGNFSQAVSSFASNMTNAFTGNAGMAAVHAGAAQASAAAASNIAAGESIFAAEGVGAASQVAELQAATQSSLTNLGAIDPTMAGQVAAETGSLASTPEQVANLGQPTAVDAPLPSAPEIPNVADLSGTQYDPNMFKPQFGADGSVIPNQALQNQADIAMFGKPVDQMTLTDMDAYTQFGKAGVIGANTPAAPTPSLTDNLKEVAKRAGQAKGLLGGGGSEEGGYQPYVPQAIKSSAVGDSSRAQGQGSAGFSLLGGVQGLEESVRRSQGLMFG